MPYIVPELRVKYDKILDQMPDIDSKGELEYCIFKTIKRFMKTKEYKYSTLHDATYGCIHAGEEFKRRYLDIREDRAIERNEDIIA